MADNNPQDLQTPATSHEYERFKQQTGLPSGSIAGLGQSFSSTEVFSPYPWDDFYDQPYPSGYFVDTNANNPFHTEQSNPFTRLPLNQAATYSQETSWLIAEYSGSGTPTASKPLNPFAQSDFLTLPSNQPLSLHTNSEWMTFNQQEMDLQPGPRRMRPNTPPRTYTSLRDSGIRKKNARFDIPVERNLSNIDELIVNCTDDGERKELKQQKRLLRNRQAAFDSRQRKKKHTEELEKEKSAWSHPLMREKEIYLTRNIKQIEMQQLEALRKQMEMQQLEALRKEKEMYLTRQTEQMEMKIQQLEALQKEKEMYLTRQIEQMEMQQLLSQPGKVRRNGLKVLVNGQPVDAFGDTGSTDNFVDQKYVRKQKLKIIPSASKMVMVDGTKLHSPGYVELDVGFPGENNPSQTIIAKVIKRFPFDLLLSQNFLKTTGSLKKHLRRFTKILFPRLTASLSMNFLSSDVSGSTLFNASFNNGILFGAVLDTGSNCNALSEDWALDRGLQIHRGEKHCGRVFLPSTGSVPTVGRVCVDMNLPDGGRIPMDFEVLEKAAVQVIIGADAILDLGLFTEYPEALSERSECEAELFHMDYKSSWTEKVVAEARKLYPRNGKAQDVKLVIRNGEAQRRWGWNRKPKDGKTALKEGEAQRRWDWNRKHNDGRSASKEDWKREYLRRYQYEIALAADNSSEIHVRLILEEPPAVNSQDNSVTVSSPPTVDVSALRVTPANDKALCSASDLADGNTFESSKRADDDSVNVATPPENA